MNFLSDDYFDVSISCNCFEHNPHWKSNLADMYRVTKEEGHLIVQIASRGFDEHGTTRTNPDLSAASQEKGWDYYMNVTVKGDVTETFEGNQTTTITKNLDVDAARIDLN